MAGKNLEAVASEASHQERMEETDLVKVSIIGVNGEWLEDQPKLGESVKLEISGYVRRVGQEALEGDDGGVRDFVQLKATGVKRIS